MCRHLCVKVGLGIGGGSAPHSERRGVTFVHHEHTLANDLARYFTVTRTVFAGTNPPLTVEYANTARS